MSKIRRGRVNVAIEARRTLDIDAFFRLAAGSPRHAALATTTTSIRTTVGWALSSVIYVRCAILYRGAHLLWEIERLR